MSLFTFNRGPAAALILLLAMAPGGLLHPLRAQAVTDSIPDPTALETPGAAAHEAATNPPPLLVPSGSATTPLSSLAPSALGNPTPLSLAAAPEIVSEGIPVGEGTILAALLAATSLGGFVLYQCGLTRAKNCAHTSTLLLLGATFALAGYWAGGFAVQTGGIGDAHAALPVTPGLEDRGVLDHELGFVAGGHHWSIMGSAGFFLATDSGSRNALAALFLVQAAGLMIAIGAALGAALERGRLVAFAVLSFLVGAVIYPLLANWIWGGGWLAGLGRGFGLGHGVVDLAGAGVVHETAGALALAIALVLGPRHGRFDRAQAQSAPIPGHNVPFIILGAIVLLLAWTSANAFALTGGPGSMNHGTAPGGSAFGLAAVNVLLGAIGGTLLSVFLSAWRRQRATPARLTRGLLGGAVALSGGSAFFDPWAALVIGGLAGLLVDGVMTMLERRRIDDPAGITAVHGAAGAWGLLATGLFANDAAGHGGMNGVDGPVRGLFFGGAWHQLAAQAIGCVVDFLAVFVLGWVALLLLQKILGNRVRLADEIQGLDWPQVGALGYQPDVESEERGES